MCFEITIFNFKHETTTAVLEEEDKIGEIRNVHITGSILMINGLLHFFSFLFAMAKTYFAYKNTRNQLVCIEKMLCDSARLFFFRCCIRLLYFLFISSRSRPKVLNFINLSSTGLCVGLLMLHNEKTTKFHLQIS